MYECVHECVTLFPTANIRVTQQPSPILDYFSLMFLAFSDVLFEWSGAKIHIFVDTHTHIFQLIELMVRLFG